MVEHGHLAELIRAAACCTLGSALGNLRYSSRRLSIRDYKRRGTTSVAVARVACTRLS